MTAQRAGVVLSSPLVDAFMAKGVQAWFQGHLDLGAEADFTQVTVCFTVIVVWEVLLFVVFKLHLFGLFFYYGIGLLWLVA